MQVFKRLQKVMLCLSPAATLDLLSDLGDAHDESVLEWPDSLLAKMKQVQEQVSDYQECMSPPKAEKERQTCFRQST